MIELDVMDASVPNIYVRPTVSDELSWKGRAVALLVAMACLGVLVVAASLEPSATGIGSHRQLGLKPCQFEAQTGVPCPTCGMTTSFAHFVRGHIFASLWVQPMGTVLALMTTMVFWVGLYIALSGRPAYRLLNLVPAKYYLWPLIFFGVAAWGWKIWIHVSGHDGGG